ncbi:2-hydroxyacid dehydrogenase [Pseudorhodoferax soli]|uniref:Lactate dehydrogenase-like 2-hydroxyacid dehydrogenase n=1 Tax=Pseudorhodoferax soli TaxID=545864 RepID=A0A368XQP1_9BURK|nr:2-hydroxyacid dehydrogenase [Pseudorhodoferax soli]RCW68847.1 lactate dehydrogenase-like 2-hydroxyacid dehydrogenase [Pseudorhodoferax soli]
MTRPRILQIGKLLPATEQALAAQYDVHLLAGEADPKAYLAREGANFVGVATSAGVGIDGATIAALPNLKVISSFGVGFDKVDVAAARARGIPVGYTPDVLNDCVADTAFGLVIDAGRRFTDSDRYLRRGDWLKGPYPLATRISGKKLGIVGLGRIGRVIARRASGFDMEVRYHNRRPVEGVEGYEATLEGLARWADFLIVAAAGGAESRHLISREILAALGPKGFLVNIARGTVVDEEALIEALENKTIAGAGLDVYEDEPRVPARLIACQNAVLLPHLASGTHETRQAMGDLVMENLRSFFATGQVAVAVP